jgi:hypothetical protein
VIQNEGVFHRIASDALCGSKGVGNAKVKRVLEFLAAATL